MRGVLILSLGLLLFGCQEYDDFDENENLVTLVILDENRNEIPTDGVIGDGETIIILQAQIPEDVKDEFRVVTFKASKGVFLGPSSDNSIVKADNKGLATTRLRVPLEDGALFLSAEIGSGINLEKADESINLIKVEEVITLTLLSSDGTELPNQNKADETTVVTLNAVVNFNEDNFNQVSFKNSGEGKFLGVNASEAKVNIDDNNIAQIQYQVSNNVGRIFFLATVGDNDLIFDDIFLDLERAYPDRMVLEPSAVNMEINQSISVNAFLIRDDGKVSLETETYFEAFQINDIGEVVEVGRFTGTAVALTDEEGKVSVTFFADSPNIDPSRPITVQASSQNDQGNPVIERVDIQIVISDE
ncbi:MAG: hypothetical protein AAGH46_02255 [Bacteroidota bacterium]